MLLCFLALVAVGRTQVGVLQSGLQRAKAVAKFLAEQGVENAIVRVADRGALDCVLRARVETAVLRGKGE